MHGLQTIVSLNQPKNLLTGSEFAAGKRVAVMRANERISEGVVDLNSGTEIAACGITFDKSTGWSKGQDIPVKLISLEPVDHSNEYLRGKHVQKSNLGARLA